MLSQPTALTPNPQFPLYDNDGEYLNPLAAIKDLAFHEATGLDGPRPMFLPALDTFAAPLMPPLADRRIRSDIAQLPSTMQSDSDVESALHTIQSIQRNALGRALFRQHRPETLNAIQMQAIIPQEISDILKRPGLIPISTDIKTIRLGSRIHLRERTPTGLVEITSQGLLTQSKTLDYTVSVCKSRQEKITNTITMPYRALANALMHTSMEKFIRLLIADADILSSDKQLFTAPAL